MRRPAPRQIAAALTPVIHRSAPPTTLARVQSSWDEAAGPVVSAEARPVAERDGVVTVACRSAVWAQELELLSAELLERVRRSLATPEPPPLRGFRFVTEASERRP